MGDLIIQVRDPLYCVREIHTKLGLRYRYGVVVRVSGKELALVRTKVLHGEQNAIRSALYVELKTTPAYVV